MGTVLEAKKLNKIIKLENENLQILYDVNLSVEDEDFVTVVGADGSGKSTLLHILGLIDVITSGELVIAGENVLELKDKNLCKLRREKLGYVFQSDNLIPTLSVEDNILLPLYLDRKRNKDYKDKLPELLEKVGLSHKKRTMVSELSECEKQRAAIARAIANDPSIILLDEPTGNLDSSNGKLVMELLQQINKYDKKTIIQATNNKDMVSYGNKLCNIKDGKLTSVEDAK